MCGCALIVIHKILGATTFVYMFCTYTATYPINGSRELAVRVGLVLVYVTGSEKRGHLRAICTIEIQTK